MSPRPNRLLEPRSASARRPAEPRCCRSMHRSVPDSDATFPIGRLLAATAVAFMLTAALLIATPPTDLLAFVLVPFVCGCVVVSGWLLGYAIRHLDSSEPLLSFLALTVFAGLFLLTVGSYLVFFVVDAQGAILPAPAPTLVILGPLLCALSLPA